MCYQMLSIIGNDPIPGKPPLTNYFDFRHSVADDEIDAQGHVHNLNYLHWTLGAASAHVKQHGWDSKAALARIWVGGSKS